MSTGQTSFPLDELRTLFGEHLQENVPLAHYTTARVGGLVSALIPVHTADELGEAAQRLWAKGMDFTVLGGGSNVLISDRGFQGIVLLNRSRNTRVESRQEPPTVWAESGANLSALARQVALWGFSGLEWASTIPGTVGGAVYGNAGAFDGDIARILQSVDLLHRSLGRVTWTAKEMAYEYRSSSLKRELIPAVILAARFHLRASTAEAVKATMEAHQAKRRDTQPPGATLGSMFKNPDGDYAGRLIDAAGLKGYQVGNAGISRQHANFFVNYGSARASDILALIVAARKAVREKFGISLILEIELLGDWLAEEKAGLGEL